MDKLKQIIADSMPKLPNTVYSDLCAKIMEIANIKIDAAKKKVSVATEKKLIIKTK